MWSVKVLNVVAPQLDNLTIRCCFKGHELLSTPKNYLGKCKYLISARNLISLTYEGYNPFPLSTDGYHSLEKVDLCICNKSQGAAEALETVRLFQQIRSVKFLTLNLEILEGLYPARFTALYLHIVHNSILMTLISMLLSSYVQVISHHPPPFANLKSLCIYPKRQLSVKKIVINISTEVKNYLLDSSQGATFTMVSRQEARENMHARLARSTMAELQRDLGREKDIIETKQDHMQQPTESDDESKYNDDNNGEPETQMQLQKLTEEICSCWRDHANLILRGDQIVNTITHQLNTIKTHLTNLPTSKRAMLQPCFSSLCAETKTFVSKMTERIQIHNSETLNNASDRFHELATSLQSSS